MIKNMQHAYTQHGMKFFVFIEPVRGNQQLDETTYEIVAHNFYVFDADGDCWCCLMHVKLSFVLKDVANGFFEKRPIYKIDRPVPPYRKPTVETDGWIRGNFDKGYALETIKGALGLDIQYLTALMEEDNERHKTA